MTEQDNKIKQYEEALERLRGLNKTFQMMKGMPGMAICPELLLKEVEEIANDALKQDGDK